MLDFFYLLTYWETVSVVYAAVWMDVLIPSPSLPHSVEICLQSSTIISPLSGDLTGLRKSKEVVYKSGSRIEDKETKLNKDVMSAKRDCKERLNHD